MSQIRHVVAWRDQASGKDYIPIDNEFYEHNEQCAKEAARDLLVPLRATRMTPLGVMPIRPEDREKLSKAPTVKIGSVGTEFAELGKPKT